MKKEKSVKSSRKQKGKGYFSTWLDSFRGININYLIVALYLVGFVIIFQAAMWMLNEGLSLVVDNLAIDVEDVELATASTVGAYASIYAMLILGYVIIMLAYSIAQMGIWTTMTDKKFKFKLIWKFFLVNLVWGTIVLATLFTVVLALKEQYLALLIFILAFSVIVMHLTFCYYYAFFSEERIFKAFGKMFNIAVKKIHKFLLPILFIGVIFLVLGIIFYLIELVAPEVVYQVLSSLVFLFFAIWTGFYYVLAIRYAVGDEKAKK